MSKKIVKNNQEIGIEDKAYWTEILNLRGFIENEINYIYNEAKSLQNELKNFSKSENIEIITRNINRIIPLISDSKKLFDNTLINIVPENSNRYYCSDCKNINEILKLTVCTMEFVEPIAKIVLEQELIKNKLGVNEISLKTSIRSWYVTCNLIRINLDYLKSEIQSQHYCNDTEKESV